MSDSKIRQAFEYSNPFSSRHDTHKDFKKLTGTQKFGTVAVCIIVATISAIATAILLGVPALFITTAVCRALVGRFTQININANKIKEPSPPPPTPPAPSAPPTLPTPPTHPAQTAPPVPPAPPAPPTPPVPPAPPTPSADTNSSEPSTEEESSTTLVSATAEEPSTPLVPSTEYESSNTEDPSSAPTASTAAAQADTIFNTVHPNTKKRSSTPISPELIKSTPLFGAHMNQLNSVLFRSVNLDSTAEIDRTVWDVKDFMEKKVGNKKPKYTDYAAVIDEVVNLTDPNAIKPRSSTPELALDAPPLAASELFGSYVMACEFGANEMAAERQRLLLTGTKEFNVLNQISSLSGTVGLNNTSLIGFKEGKICIVNEEEADEFPEIFVHLLAETYGKELSELVTERLKLNTVRRLTWKDLQASLIIVAANVKAKDLIKLYNLLKGSSSSSSNAPAELHCYKGILTPEEIEQIKHVATREELTPADLEILLKPFRAVKLGNDILPTATTLIPIVRSAHIGPKLEFDPLLHDMELLTAINSYQGMRTDRMESDPETTVSEYLAKVISYQEVKPGMVISLPVMDSEKKIHPRHYQVFNEITHADGIMFNLMVPLNPQSSVKGIENPEEIHLNFRGSGVSPDQACSGATWERNFDLQGVGKSIFDKHEKYLLGTVINYLKTNTSNEIVLNISGHSLGGCDVNRAITSFSRQIANAPLILNCFTTIVESLSKIDDEQSLESSNNAKDVIKAQADILLPLLDSQKDLVISDAEKRELSEAIESLKLISNNDELANDIRRFIVSESTKTLISNLELWKKVKTINATSHNSPRPECALNDQLTKALETIIANSSAENPPVNVNVNHVRFEDRRFEDIVQKCGDVLVGANIVSPNFKVKVTRVKIAAKFGLVSGIVKRHGFRAYCQDGDKESVIEEIVDRDEINKILLNRYYWKTSDKEKAAVEENRISGTLATLGWYGGYVPRYITNTTQAGIWAIYSTALHTVRWALGGTRALTDPKVMRLEPSSSNSSSSSGSSSPSKSSDSE